jgi:hypothetical protein
LTFSSPPFGFFLSHLQLGSKVPVNTDRQREKTYFIQKKRQTRWLKQVIWAFFLNNLEKSN